jgi:O-methyltransferase
MVEIKSEPATEMYLDLMKKCLTRSIFPERYRPIARRPSMRVHPFAWTMYPLITLVLAKLKMKLYLRTSFDPAARAEGRDAPGDAETMVGLKRLDNLQYCVSEIIRKNVPGDLIETGAWRGGASIFMRALASAYGDQTRIVWVADSFEGLPRPDGRYEQDAGDRHWEASHFGVSLEEVKANFARYGLLDERVRFLAGWFKDTLPAAPIDRLALLRLDGDMYSSTMDALRSLYDKVSPGGYVIIDDYGAIPNCKRAVDDFRAERRISEQLHRIDWTGVFWEKLT